jgi:hypothetical protein
MVGRISTPRELSLALVGARGPRPRVTAYISPGESREQGESGMVSFAGRKPPMRIRTRSIRIAVCRRIGSFAVSWLAFFLLSAGFAWAETYGGIGAKDTLGDIRQRFPGATFERLNPAWAQAGDVLYSVTGAGLSGSIVVKFFDVRSEHEIQTYAAARLRGLSNSGAEMLAAQQSRLKLLSDDEALVVEWVRWVPDRPIPLQRFIAKYGPPTRSDFAKDNLQPYRDWTEQGLTAYLDDAEKSVVRVDYAFTDKEQCEAGVAWATKINLGVELPCVDRFPQLKRQK